MQQAQTLWVIIITGTDIVSQEAWVRVVRIKQLWPMQIQTVIKLTAGKSPILEGKQFLWMIPFILALIHAHSYLARHLQDITALTHELIKLDDTIQNVMHFYSHIT